MTDSATCTDISLALGESMGGTAPAALGWVLLEQKGAWGAKALTESGLDQDVGAELERRAKALGLKALLVKPPGRDPSKGRTVFLASSIQDASFVEELEIGDPAEILELDLAPLARGELTGAGALADAPLYLVCTNGKRDACCSRLGRAVARSLASARPGRVWECSHIGGHRFAANVVCLPEGLCYGRVQPGNAALLAEEHEAGRVVLELLRGRSAFPPAVQAAEHFLRAHGRVGAGERISLIQVDDGRTTFDLPGGQRLSVDVAEAEGPVRPASCGAEPEASARFKLISIAEH